jgi:3-dehydroquinate dehydratase-2
MKILVIHGPNLQQLGFREPSLYGLETLEELHQRIREEAVRLDVTVEFFQSHVEGELVREIASAAGRVDGILINPAAYTHTSVALRDALQSVVMPCVEVHLSNVAAREEFRRPGLTTGACVGQVSGFGGDSYLLGLRGLADILRRRSGQAGKKGAEG